MNNQVLLWSMFIVPWLSLFLMKKEDVKRFIPVALFTLSVSVIVTEIGITTGLWHIRENTFPLTLIPTYTYGLFPVAAMWILRFTYGRFWIYLIIELVVNLIYAYILLPWIASRGILDFNYHLISYFIANGQGMLLYLYQMWQEDDLVPAVKKLSTKLQPTATKPFLKNEEIEENKR